MNVRTAKTQISLGIRPVWSESSLCAQWVAKDPSFLHADSEDPDQTGWMPRLIWVFAGRTTTLLVLSCRGSIISTSLFTKHLLQPSVFYTVFHTLVKAFARTYEIFKSTRALKWWGFERIRNLVKPRWSLTDVHMFPVACKQNEMWTIFLLSSDK